LLGGTALPLGQQLLEARLDLALLRFRSGGGSGGPLFSFVLASLEVLVLEGFVDGLFDLFHQFPRIRWVLGRGILLPAIGRRALASPTRQTLHRNSKVAPRRSPPPSRSLPPNRFGRPRAGRWVSARRPRGPWRPLAPGGAPAPSPPGWGPPRRRRNRRGTRVR